MHKFMTSALFALGLCTASAALPAMAAPVEQVVAACDRMDAEKPGSCRYTVTKDGLGGCTRNGCFFCPVDGSRQCYAMRTSGKGPRLDIGGVQMKCDPGAGGWCGQTRVPSVPPKAADR